MADLITVSAASMLNTSRATAASAMLRVSSKKKIYACAFGGGNILWRKLVVAEMTPRNILKLK